MSRWKVGTRRIRPKDVEFTFSWSKNGIPPQSERYLRLWKNTILRLKASDGSSGNEERNEGGPKGQKARGVSEQGRPQL